MDGWMDGKEGTNTNPATTPDPSDHVRRRYLLCRCPTEQQQQKLPVPSLSWGSFFLCVAFSSSSSSFPTHPIVYFQPSLLPSSFFSSLFSPSSIYPFTHFSYLFFFPLERSCFSPVPRVSTQEAFKIAQEEEKRPDSLCWHGHMEEGVGGPFVVPYFLFLSFFNRAYLLFFMRLRKKRKKAWPTQLQQPSPPLSAFLSTVAQNAAEKN